MTGQLIRAPWRSANRYEHHRPGSLVHVDVKKLGRSLDGGLWRPHGRGIRARSASPEQEAVAVDGVEWVNTF